MNRVPVFGLLAACLAPHPQAAWAQMNMGGHVMETRDELAPAGLPAPLKMAGVGNVHMKVTAAPEAQMWFDQGLNLLHDFWDYESARAFEQAIRVDTQCAMCYWGLYQAESFYHSTESGYAGQAVASAVRLEGHASQRERLYIEASAAREQALKNRTAGGRSPRELELLRNLVKRYPKDTQARIFLANRTGGEAGLALLRSVLKEDPDNSAANHYYIHALEAGPHPEQALASAEILAGLAPASGHMVHMPGHIFCRLGGYARAEQAFAASQQVDERYMREQHVQPDYDWNYVHNLMYAVANLLEEGKLSEAVKLSAKLSGARGELEPTFYIYSARDAISRLDARLPVALRTGDWPPVMALLEGVPPAGHHPNLEFLARQISGFAAGMQAVETHDIPKAQEWSAQFDAGLWRMSQWWKDSQPVRHGPGNGAAPSGPPKLMVMPDAELEPLLDTLSIMSLELRASLAASQKNTAEAKGLFARAAEEERALGYREPPSYIRPVGETEGAAMMLAGDFAEARAAYERALAERPRSGLVLYGIAMSSEKSGDSQAAAKEYADFLAAWKQADPGLPQVAHARAYLAGHPV